MKQRAFDHVLIIMFENQYRGYVMKNDYMRHLAAQGIELTNSFGVMHPSQTNYITSISGELCNVSDDDRPPVPLTQNTIVDLIEGSPCQLNWKAYMDSYIADDTPWQAEDFDGKWPAPVRTVTPAKQPDPFTPQDHFPYLIKHNPFSSYKNIVENQQRWQKVDNEAGFYRDLLNNTLPEYCWFTPNMWNDGHYLVGTTGDSLQGERAPVLVDQQAKWLKSFFDGLSFPGPQSKLPPNTLVVVTYDEADFEAFYDNKDDVKYTYDGPNQVYTVLLGDGITPGKEDQGYNHYSLLKTIEQNFNLGDLGKNDREANWFQFLWGKEYRWQMPQDTPLNPFKNMAAASLGQQLFVASSDDKGRLSYRTFDGAHWSQAIHLADDCYGQLSLAANDGELLLACHNDDQYLTVMRYDLVSGWQKIAAPTGEATTHLSLVAVPNQPRFVLVNRNGQGELFSHEYADGQWQQGTEPLCCNTDSDFKLAALGTTLLLIFTLPSSNKLACLSYNTAEFNKVTVLDSKYAGSYDNTTVNQWSANAFTLNHFSYGPSAITPEEPEPTTQSYEAAGALATATLDGVLHLMHNNPGNNQLLSETFSISGTLTPEKPVSYDPAKQTTTSNGYGTLFEAGWSTQTAINGVVRDADGPLFSARLRDKVWLFYQPLGGNCVLGVVGEVVDKV